MFVVIDANRLYSALLTKGVYSACKRIMGEYVSATKTRNMYHEVKVKFWVYNQLIRLKK